MFIESNKRALSLVRSGSRQHATCYPLGLHLWCHRAHFLSFYPPVHFLRGVTPSLSPHGGPRAVSFVTLSSARDRCAGSLLGRDGSLPGAMITIRSERDVHSERLFCALYPKHEPPNNSQADVRWCTCSVGREEVWICSVKIILAGISRQFAQSFRSVQRRLEEFAKSSPLTAEMQAAF